MDRSTWESTSRHYLAIIMEFLFMRRRVETGLNETLANFEAVVEVEVALASALR